MSETIQSTPLTNDENDIFTEEKFSDTSVDEPENFVSENEESAVEADVKTDGNGLIFGKFKSLDEAEKGYKEAERAITRAANLEKEMQAYQQLFGQYEQDAIARGKGYADRLDMALDHDVRQHELDDYVLAASYMLPPEQKLQVTALINQCRQTGSPADMAHIRRYFSPEIISLAAEDVALYKNARRQDYEQMRHQDKSIRYTRKLKAFEDHSGNWIDSPLKKELLEQAVEISDGKVDLDALKEVVDAVEISAIRKYQAAQDFRRQNAEAQDSLREPGGGNVRNKNKKWLTKEAFYKLTPQQEAEKYDLIVEQVLLEKEGKLPKMLTL